MIRICASCSQKNRVSAHHLASSGRCGKCKAPLSPLATPLDVDAEEFHQIVGAATVPILVDFWAAWCGPCRMAAPHVKQVAEDLAGKALVLKVNTENEPGLAREYHVSGIPHFVVLKEGRIISSQSGLVDHRQMRRWLESA